jgi:hypothetical protein
MANDAEMKKLAVKAIEDEKFGAELLNNPEKAAASIGITLTADQIAKIKAKKSQAEAAGNRESKSIIFI